MRASKDPLERWGCLLPFWYSTPRQISDQTTPDFNLLAAACSQVWIDVVIWSSLFGGDIAGLSVTICYGAFKSDAPTCNLVTIIKSFLWRFFDVIMFSSKIFEPNCHFDGFLLLLNPVWESSTLLDAISSLRNIVISLPWNLSGCLLIQNLANLSFRASLSKVGCQ
jgi:hypothetical protein